MNWDPPSPGFSSALALLEQRVDGKSRKRVIEVMEDVDHLSKLVNELLAFSRADLKSNTVQARKNRSAPGSSSGGEAGGPTGSKDHYQNKSGNPCCRIRRSSDPSAGEFDKKCRQIRR